MSLLFDDCVENNRRGMTRYLMTGVTQGVVQGVRCRDCK